MITQVVGAGVQRELIYQTFFDALKPLVQAEQGGGGIFPQLFNMVSRRYWAADKLGEEEYPALFLVEAGELYHRMTLNIQAKVELVCNLILMSNVGVDPDVVAATEVNLLADAVDAAISQLAKQGGAAYGQNTLGGLVNNVYLTGRTVDIIASGSNVRSMQRMEVTMVTTQRWN